MKLADALEIVGMALATLRRSPMRSTLTILGLAIGVGAFIAMTSFGQGARTSVVAQFAGLGANVVRVDSQYRSLSGVINPPRPLVAEDLHALRRDLTGVSLIVPSVRARVASRSGAKTFPTVLIGATSDYFPLHDWGAASGGAFDANDETGRSKVCVLGATVNAELFGDADAVGKTVSLGDSLTCTVLGVLEVKGASTSGKDLDDLIVIPLATYEAYVGIPDGYTMIELEASSKELVASTRLEATEILDRAHEIDGSDVRDFVVTSPTEAIKAADNVSSILATLLAVIASISLVVGGIGIMNIQFVAVAERTREIGIRSALGAAPNQILGQFLAESVVLSALGALLGVGIGVVASILVARQMGWSSAVDSRGVAIATAFGIGAGVIFGYLPASRASELEPVDALRHE